MLKMEHLTSIYAILKVRKNDLIGYKEVSTNLKTYWQGAIDECEELIAAVDQEIKEQIENA